MAGIGFALRRLSSRDSIAGPLLSLGNAVWVSAGPLVLTATALLAMSSLAADYVSAREFSLFGVLLTYAVILALVVASPIAVIVTRLVADCVYLRHDTQIPSLFVAGLSCTAAATALAGALFWSALPLLPARVAATGWMLSQSVAMLWVAAVFCGTLRDYSGVTAAFLVGILLSVGAILALAPTEPDVMTMAWSMAIGNLATTLTLAARLLLSSRAVADLSATVRRIGRALQRFPLLVIGAVAGALGMWIDKWVIWNSSQGNAVVAGLVYAPIYDTAMFTSFLFIVPALAAFIVHIETNLDARLTRVMSQVLGRGTLDEIEVENDQLGMSVRASVFHLLLIQAAITACAVVALPLIVGLLGMPFRQIPIMRFGLLGSVFHLLFLICCSVLLFINRQRAYCMLQLAFMVLNGVATSVCLQFGPDISGLGYFVAALVCGSAAYLWLDRTLSDLVYLIFASADSSADDAPEATSA